MDVGFLCIDEVGEEVHLVAFGGERKRERGDAAETHKGGGAMVKKRIISEEGEGEGVGKKV